LADAPTVRSDQIRGDAGSAGLFDKNLHSVRQDPPAVDRVSVDLEKPRCGDECPSMGLQDLEDFRDEPEWISTVFKALATDDGVDGVGVQACVKF